jgi:hypothetical protein
LSCKFYFALVAPIHTTRYLLAYKKFIAPLRGLKSRGHLDPALRLANSARLRLGYQDLALRAEFIIFIFFSFEAFLIYRLGSY